MSKFIELLKLLPLGIANADKIVEGFITNVKLEHGTLPEDQAEEIARRRLICSQCPFMSDNAKQLTGFKTSRTDSFCTLCSCPIKGKTASLESNCGADSYNKLHPNKPPIEVKWTAYDNNDKQERPDKASSGN